VKALQGAVDGVAVLRSVNNFYNNGLLFIFLDRREYISGGRNAACYSKSGGKNLCFTHFSSGKILFLLRWYVLLQHEFVKIYRR
jgi:hypothetical protein